MTNPWIAGARLRTLPAAVVPVAVGTAVAIDRLQVDDGPWDGGIAWWRAGCALIVALALQVAVNYANDYSDGIRGTDDERRVGPQRLVGSGLVEPAAVKKAAFISFGVAGLFGALLALAVGPELFAVGIASILAGWFYTGGSNPYGYLGLGELFVFVFFGLVATAGTVYVLVESLDWASLVWGCAVGAIACALLVINNLRDIPGDTEVGKNTLAVRLGDGRTRILYIVLMLTPWLITAVYAFGRPALWLPWAALPLAMLAIKAVRDGAAGQALIGVLGQTGRAQLAWGVLSTVGLLLA